MIKKRILEVMECILIVFIIAMVMNMLINGIERCSLFGYKTAYVKSESMEPNIMTHATCLIRLVDDYDDYEVGDVIVYKKYGKMIIHRVLEKHDTYMVTKGDNNKRPDNWKVYPEDVLAKTVYVFNWPAKLF